MKTLTQIAMTLMIVGGSASTLGADEMDGKQLFLNKCATCHSMTQPVDESKVVAPPAQGVMFHMAEAFGDNEKIKAHIKDFVINPSREKAICRSVRRFGVMPSQKGAVSEKELNEIAEWMVEHLSMDKEEHRKMERGHRGHGRGMHRGEGRGMRRGAGQGHGQGKHQGSTEGEEKR